MEENLRSSGDSPERERGKTTVLREGPPRREVIAAMEEAGAAVREKGERLTESATLIEGLAGTCAAVLAVIALVGTFPLRLTAVGVIVLGGSILLGAGGFAAIAGRLRHRVRWGELLAGGADLKALAAAAAVAGGILVLADVVPMTLLPVSMIVLGCCYLMGSGGLQFFMAAPRDVVGRSQEMTAVEASAVEILVGLAAVTLGVLALAGMNPLVFSEVAVLTLGSGMLAKCMAFSACVGARAAAGERRS